MTKELVIKQNKTLKNLLYDLDKIIEYANNTTIDSDDSKKVASDNIGSLKSYRKKTEDEKLLITKPFRDAVNKFNMQVKEIDEKASSALTILNKKYIDYQLAQEKKIKEEQELAKQKELEELRRIAIEATTSIENQPELSPLISEMLAPIEQKIAFIENSDTTYKSNPTRGEAFTTGLKKNYKARIINKSEFYEYAVKTKNYDLIEPNLTMINAIARIKKQECIENGIEYYLDYSTSTR